MVYPKSLYKHETIRLYPKETAEQVTNIRKAVSVGIAKQLLKKPTKKINQLYKYLDTIYIPIGAVGGLIAVIVGGLNIISPWITVLYILLWTVGYFTLNKL